MQQQLNIDIKTQTTEIRCANCKGKAFQQSYFLRKAPKLLLGEREDRIIPIQIFHCVACNEVLEELLPNELKSDKFEDVTPKKGIILG